MRYIGALLIVLIFCVPAAAQSPVQVELQDLEIPMSPAFALLDASPSVISHPHSAKALAASIGNMLDLGDPLNTDVVDILPKDFGVEFNPVWLFPQANLSALKYAGVDASDYGQNVFAGLRSNSAVSMGFLTIDTTRHISLGARTTAVRVRSKDDVRNIADLYKQAAEAVASVFETLDEYFDPETGKPIAFPSEPSDRDIELLRMCSAATRQALTTGKILWLWDDEAETWVLRPRRPGTLLMNLISEADTEELSILSTDIKVLVNFNRLGFDQTSGQFYIIPKEQVLEIINSTGIYIAIRELLTKRPSLSLNAAVAASFAFTSTTFQDVAFDKFGGWLTLDIALNPGADAAPYVDSIAYARYRFENLYAEANGSYSSNIDFGLKLLSDWRQLSLSIEGIGRYDLVDTMLSDYRVSGELGVAIAETTQIRISFGKNLGNADNIITSIAVNWGFGDETLPIDLGE